MPQPRFRPEPPESPNYPQALTPSQILEQSGTGVNAIFVTFLPFIGGDAFLGIDVTNRLPVTLAITPCEASCVMSSAPIGDDFVARIVVYHADASNDVLCVVRVEDGSTTGETSEFSMSLVDGDVLGLDVISVGSTTPGSQPTIVLQGTATVATCSSGDTAGISE